MCRHYEQTLPKSGSPDAAVLDICSSWISHYPVDYKLDRVAGDASLTKFYEVIHLNNNSPAMGERTPLQGQFAMLVIQALPALPHIIYY